MENSTLGVALVLTQDSVTPQLKGLTNTLADNKAAIRELAMGTMMLGGSFMAVGVALKGTNSQLGQSIGQTLMMAGSIMTAIGSTVHFISAISKTVHALETLAASEAIVQALTNPLFLLLGLAAGAGVIAGISALNKGESKANTNLNANITINNDVSKASRTIQTQMILTQDRNAGKVLK